MAVPGTTSATAAATEISTTPPDASGESSFLNRQTEALRNSSHARRVGGVLIPSLTTRLPWWPFVVSLLAAVWLAACASGGDEVTPTATAETTAAPTPTTILTTPPGMSTLNADTVIDLATQDALLTIIGADVGDFKSDLGALASGDFNGDGFVDLLAGARFGDGPDNSREDAGEAYLIFGSPDHPQLLDLAKGQPDVAIWGENAGDGLGLYVAAGDLDSDGFDDIIVGAPFAKSRTVEGGEPGKAYVIYGRAELPSTIDLADSEQDVSLIGATSGAFFGDSLATGDVNGDGAPDLIVGATFERHGPALVQAGAAYVVYGGGRWAEQLQMAAQDYDVAIFGAEEFDELGDNVASGDLNGDGFHDVVITAEAADGPNNSRPVAAEVHALFGSASLQGEFRVLDEGQDLSVLGAEAQDTLGFALATGDVDGDGIDDIAMGARLANNPMSSRNSAGAVYVLFGSSDPPSVIDLAETPAGLTVYYGADGSDFLGGSLATGDLGGDGTVELIVAAPFGDGPANSRTGAGEVYVIPRLLPGTSVSIGDLTLSVVVYGAAPEDKLGSALATGDFNGDGRDEIFVSATEADGLENGLPDVGRIYILSLAP